MLLAFPTLSVPASSEQLMDAIIMCSEWSAALCLTWLIQAELETSYSDSVLYQPPLIGRKKRGHQNRTS